MEVNITSFVTDADPFDYSRSVAEYGQDAGPSSWSNAMAHEPALLTSDSQLDEWRDYVRGFGAWDDTEIDAWSPQEVNALFVQYISGDIREAEALVAPSIAEWSDDEWTAYQDLAERGTINGNLFTHDGGVWYFVS